MDRFRPAGQPRRSASNAPPRWNDAARLNQFEQWCGTVLRTRGITIVSPFEPIRAWGVSAVFQVRTTHGTMIAKAVSPACRNEPMITAQVAGMLPGYALKPIAIDATRGWLLNPAAPGALLRGQPLELWPRVMGAIAEMPGRLANPRTVSQLGLHDHRPERLLADSIRTLRVAHGLAGDGTLHLVPQAALYGYVAPLINAWPVTTVLHGDLNAGNIFLASDRVTLIDWSDAVIGHPFVDVWTLLLSEDQLGDRRDRETLAEAYLSALSIGATDASRAAFAAAIPLALLHLVKSVTRLAEAMESTERADVLPSLSYWLKVWNDWAGSILGNP